MICRSTATRITPRRQLSKAEFGQICFEASKSNTYCAAYISVVHAKLCTFLGIHEPLEALPMRTETGLENVQAVVAGLYFLLEERCGCDFDVAEVLNSYETDSRDRLSSGLIL